jgi:hypothetical protein
MCDFNNTTQIQKNLHHYQEIWDSEDYSFPTTQTEFFRSAIPLEPKDFTDISETYKLPDIFNSGKVVTEMRGPFNCNMLWRQTQKMPHVIIHNTETHVVLHPLGEPGLALGDHANRVSHLMVLPKSNVPEHPITVNEMLPSSDMELSDFKNRLTCLEMSYFHMRENSPLKSCGSMVIERASDMGIPDDTPIRKFMALQIASFTPEFREGRPGYKLLSESGIDYAGGGLSVLESLIGNVFTDDSLKITKGIQGPSDCSQLVSHIHGFLLAPGDIPEGLQTSYICADTLYNIKIKVCTESTY